MAAGGATRKQLTPVKVESARILDVDLETYTLSVATEFSNYVLTGVPFATPYQHFANGEGIYFMPEVGSLCWLCFPSDGNRPFVMGWAPPNDEGDTRGQKRDLNPGDIFMGTRDENFLILRRGGVVQIGGGPLSQRMYLPVGNLIKDFCENYSLHTLAGEMEWTVARSENSRDGRRPSSMVIRGREYANDKSPIATLQIGSHGEGDSRILSLQIKGSGQAASEAKIELSFDKEGNAVWDFKKDVDWTVGGDFSLEVGGDLELTATGDATLKGRRVRVEGLADVQVQAGGALVLGASGGIQMGASASAPVVVGDGSATVLTGDAGFLVWLATHQHMDIAPGQLTSPPVNPPTGIQISHNMKA